MNSAWQEIGKGPFILVTVGTDHHPFDRVTRWADAWAAQVPEPRLFVQSGTSSQPTKAAFQEYLSYEDLSWAIEASLGVVCQGGPATIMEVRKSGRLPIVVPRRVELGEHVNDHQWLFTKRLAAVGKVRLVETEEDFVAAMKELVADPQAFRLEPEDDQHVKAAIAAFESLVAPLIAKRHGRR